jgi:hypothetical protein
MNYDHEIKSQPPFFQDVLDGRKTFEIRFDDRNYCEGDRLLMREYTVSGWASIGRYTGRRMECVVGYITNFAQKPGCIVFGVHSVKRLDDAT